MTKHTLVLGIANDAASSHLRRLISLHPRFELVGLASTAISTLYMVEVMKPSVVLMADESPGLRGRDVLAEISAASPNSLVIITTPGEPEALIGRPGVAEAVPQDDLDAISEALAGLADFLDDPTAFVTAERRAGRERRSMQDWSKVFAERRAVPRRTAGAS